MAGSDASAAAATADLRLRAALAAPTLPTLPTTNVSAVPPQGGRAQPTIPATNVGAVPPQWGTGQPDGPHGDFLVGCAGITFGAASVL